MRYKPNQYALALFEALEEKFGKSREAIIQRFVALVVKNNDRSLLGRILRQYERMYYRRKGIKNVSVTAAKKVTRSVIAAIGKRLGSDINIKETIDPTVLGGVRIMIDNELLIDGTFQDKIEKLYKKLVSAAA